MTASLYVGWFACAAAAAAVLQFIQMPLRRRRKGIWICALSFAVKALAATGVAFFAIALCNRLVWNLGYLPGALYAALLCDAAADLAALLIAPLRKKPRMLMLLSLLLTAAFVIGGTVNMETVVPKEHTYTSDKIRETHRFVFLSDLHYGSAQSDALVEKTLQEIDALAPDFVLLGGDIVDDHTSAEEMRRIFARLGEIGAPVYYIYGNHDRQSHGDFIGGPFFTPEELEETILDSGLIVLKDEIAQISEDLAILGREDAAGDARCAVSELPAFPDGAYVICVDHDPYLEDEILATGADLQLSGHTHDGQFFPLQYVYRFGVNNIYGDYRLGGTDLYVSSGVSGWYYPLRTAARCNYELITLKAR